jgi:hypothetical protein
MPPRHSACFISRLAAIAALGLLLPPSLIARNPAAPTVFNVRNLGAKANGRTNDSSIIKSIVKTAKEGGVVYFPPGEYACQGIVIENAKGLVIRGDGAASTLRPLSSTKATPILLFKNCQDVVVRDLTFDMGNQPIRGIGVTGCKNVRVIGNHFTQPLGAAGQQPSVAYFVDTEDLWFTDNLVQGLFVQHNNVRRGHFTGNTITGGKFGIATIVAAGQYADGINIADNVFQGVTGPVIVFAAAPGGSARVSNVSIHDNRISRSSPGTSITVGTDPTKSDTAAGEWSGIVIGSNTIQYRGDSATGAAISIGGAGTVYTDIVARDNIISGTGAESTGILLRQVRNATVTGNSIIGLATGIALTAESRQCLVVDNRVTDCATVGYQLTASGGDNVMTGNYCFGTCARPTEFSGKRPTDRVERTELIRLR